MSNFNDPIFLPLGDSAATEGFNERYMQCYNLVLKAERNAIDTYNSRNERPAKLAEENLISARVTGGFLIHFHRKRHILGDGPANALVSNVLSGSKPSDAVVYQVGKLLRDRLIYAFRMKTTTAAPCSSRPSRSSSTTLEDMLAQTVEASGTDYQTSRKKTLVRDGYQCIITGFYDKNSCLRNKELGALVEERNGPEAPVQSCHILKHLEEDGSETPSRRAHSNGALEILKQFHLDHLVDELVEKGGIHSLRNLISLIQPLREAFDSLDLWFDQTDEENTYEVQVSRDRILTGYANVNRRPHFVDNKMLEQSSFKDVHLALPDPGLLALHAVCACVAHMSGSAEYFYKLERETEDTMVVSEDSLHLINNLLSPFTVV